VKSSLEPYFRHQEHFLEEVILRVHVCVFTVLKTTSEKKAYKFSCTRKHVIFQVTYFLVSKFSLLSWKNNL